MEKNTRVKEPNFEGEEMHLPTASVSKITEEVAPQRILSAPIIVLLFLILVAILGGFYYWYTIVMSEQAVIQDSSRPTAEENNEPESTTAEARTDLMGVVSTSDELDAIGADAKSTNLEDLNSEIIPIEIELEAALKSNL